MVLDTGGLDVPSMIWFFAALAVLSGAAAAIQHAAGLGLGIRPLTAIARASLQLAVVAVLLRGVLSAPWTAALFLALMLTTASYTSSRHLAEQHRGVAAALAGVVAGAVTAVGLVLALRLAPFDARSIIATAGIIVGNSMTAATLSGRNFVNTARARRDEIEGWFALGAQPLQAHHDIRRVAMREALIPNIDQTKATGIVTLPGAFVGALMGGLSPWSAAQFQLVVLAGIGLAMTVTSLVVTRLLSGSPTVPAAQ